MKLTGQQAGEASRLRCLCIAVCTVATRLGLAYPYSFWPQWSQVSEPLLEGIHDDLFLTD